METRGRPEIGPPIHVRLPRELLAQVDAARKNNEPRAATIRRLLKLALSTLAVLLAFASTASAGWRVAPPQRTATTLLTPEGQPVAGRWQRWMNEDRMPSYRGSMLLDVSGQDVRRYCWWGNNAGANACSSATPLTAEGNALATLPETVIGSYEAPQDGFSSAWELRDTLYYEQAHIIDFKYLTDPERVVLMKFWGLSRNTAADWWAGESNIWTNSPPGEMFAEGYRVCAEGMRLADEPEVTYQLVTETQRQEDRFCAIVRSDVRPSS